MHEGLKQKKGTYQCDLERLRAAQKQLEREQEQLRRDTERLSQRQMDQNLCQVPKNLCQAPRQGGKGFPLGRAGSDFPKPHESEQKRDSFVLYSSFAIP